MGSESKILPEVDALTKLTEASLTFCLHQSAVMDVDRQTFACLQMFLLSGKCKFDHLQLRLA